MLSVKHLIDTNSLTRDDIQQILDTAQSFEAVNNRDIKRCQHFVGAPLLTCFWSLPPGLALHLSLPRNASRLTL